jgi:hypothetical protein
VCHRANFIQTRERWMENYHTMRDYALWSVPWPMRILVGLMVHRSIEKTLHGQGTGRYAAEEIRASRLQIWTAINDLLVPSRRAATAAEIVPRPFWVLGGDDPTEADATLFGFIVSVLTSTA